MLYRKSLRLLLAVALVATPALARQKVAQHVVPDVERLREHINYLASDKLEGRRTGTPGALEAARYVAEEFRRLGLAPGGDSANARRVDAEPRDYMREFPYVAAVELGKSNEMTLTARAACGSATGTLATPAL